MAIHLQSWGATQCRRTSQTLAKLAGSREAQKCRNQCRAGVPRIWKVRNTEVFAADGLAVGCVGSQGRQQHDLRGGHARVRIRRCSSNSRCLGCGGKLRVSPPLKKTRQLRAGIGLGCLAGLPIKAYGRVVDWQTARRGGSGLSQATGKQARRQQVHAKRQGGESHA